MNALIISHNYPPLNRVASYRPYSFARALADAGCEVTVLTSRKRPSMGDLSLDHDPRGITMLEVPIDEPDGGARSRWAWVVRCALALRRRSREGDLDLIVSSHGPSSSHVLGSVASELWRRAFWVADYRDPWTTATYDRKPGALDPLKRAMERRLLSRARLVTTVSEGYARAIRPVVPGVPLHVVGNGFDRPLAPSEPSRAETPPPRSSGPRTLLYTGSLYPARLASLRMVFAALSDLRRDGLSPADIQIELMGSDVDRAGADAQAAGVGEFVSVLGMRSRGETHDRQDACDALLLPEGSEAARSGVMTAKVYEYLAAGPPVLVVGPDADTELGRLIVESGAGVCLGTDRAAIARAIGRVAAGDAHELSHRRIEVIARHERGRLAASFLHILRDAGLPLADPVKRLADGGTR